MNIRVGGTESFENGRVRLSSMEISKLVENKKVEYFPVPQFRCNNRTDHYKLPILFFIMYFIALVV